MTAAAYLSKHCIPDRAPRLWIKRLTIFRRLGADAASSKVVRDVPLFRGLNIIQGMETPDPPPGTRRRGRMMGHSVGKTSFCRLIRHCLGEERYGSRAQRERIDRSFPEGYVGMEAILDGRPWAILRQLGPGTNAHAAPGMGLNHFIAERAQHHRFENWREELGNRLVCGVTGFASDDSTDPATRWLKLLSWCARDQETRFRKLWEWRDSSSESGDPKIQRPSEEGLSIMRGVLGLLDQDEASIEDDARKLGDRIAEIDHQIEELLLEPGYWLRHHQSWLRQEIAKHKLAEDHVFGLEAMVTALESKLDALVSAWELRVDSLNEDRADAESRLQRAGRTVERRRREEVVDEEIAKAWSQESGADEKLRRQLDQLHDVQAKRCEFGGIDFADCEAYRINTAEKEAEATGKVQPSPRAEREAREDLAQAEARALFAEIAKEERAARRLKSEELYNNLEQSLGDLVHRIRTAEANLASFKSQRREVAEHRMGWDEAEGLTSGRHGDPRLDVARSERGSLQAQRDALLEKRNARYAIYTTPRTALTGVFNELVQDVLSDEYGGHIDLSGKSGLSFTIRDNSTLTGQAVETLSILLADVSAMLASNIGLGRHPAFLLHDSPREGDLDRHHYMSFIAMMHEIHEALGGTESAPFQYILTTTTPPPPEGDPDVRMRLRAKPVEDMLFRVVTGSPPGDDGESVHQLVLL